VIEGLAWNRKHGKVGRGWRGSSCGGLVWLTAVADEVGGGDSLDCKVQMCEVASVWMGGLDGWLAGWLAASGVWDCVALNCTGELEVKQRRGTH
jgi:hypothetical protein